MKKQLLILGLIMSCGSVFSGRTSSDESKAKPLGIIVPTKVIVKKAIPRYCLGINTRTGEINWDPIQQNKRPLYLVAFHRMRQQSKL